VGGEDEKEPGAGENKGTARTSHTTQYRRPQKRKVAGAAGEKRGSDRMWLPLANPNKEQVTVNR